MDRSSPDRVPDREGASQPSRDRKEAGLNADNASCAPPPSRFAANGNGIRVKDRAIGDKAAVDSPAASRSKHSPSRWRQRLAAAQPALAFAAVLLAGIAMRAWLVADTTLGHMPDLNIFTRWIARLQELGLAGFYAAEGFCDYPPLSVLLFAGLGHLATLLPGGVESAPLLRILLKSATCLADLAIAVMLFVEARRLFAPASGERVGIRRLALPAATAAAALFFLNPVVLYDSAYWGQVDTIYAACVLLALIMVGRGRWLWCGAAAAAGLLLKFQTMAFVPLLVFEVYRRGRWRAVGGMGLAAIATAAVVLAPFAWTGTLDDVMTRSYVHVVGQYNDMSKSAYNLWYVVGSPRSADTAVPGPILRAATGGELVMPESQAWMLAFNWRRISLILFALAVAAILSLYSLRPTHAGRYGAAGLLGLAFFLFPTEMHERYAVHALPMLALWAVSGAWKERTYMLLSAMLLLNIAAIQPAANVSPHIAMTLLLVFGVMLIMIAARSRPQVATAAIASRGSVVVFASPDVDAGAGAESAALTHREPLASRSDRIDPEPRLIPWFRRLTAVSLVLLAGAGVWLWLQDRPAPAAEDDGYLSRMRPASAFQGWGALTRDTAVSGSPMRLGGNVYFRGLGTHAPSRLVYEIPEDALRFTALVGIDAGTGGQGSVRAVVEVDGRRVFTSEVLRGGDPPVEIDVAVVGAKRLTLLAEPADDQRADHVNWALAKFVLDQP